jgi:hypothetical protein
VTIAIYVSCRRCAGAKGVPPTPPNTSMTGPSVASAALGMPSDTPRTRGSRALKNARNRDAERTFVVETIAESVTKRIEGLHPHAPSARRSGARTTFHRECKVADSVSRRKSSLLNTSTRVRRASKHTKRLVSISNSARAKQNLRARVVPTLFSMTLAARGTKLMKSTAANA